MINTLVLRLVSITVVLLVFAPQVIADNIVHLTTKLWPSYQYNSEESGLLSGVSVNTIRCVFKQLERPVEFQLLPWKRAQVNVQRGISDGFFSASQNEGRDQYAVLSEPISSQKWTWITIVDAEEDPLSKNFKDSATVVGILGSNMTRWAINEGYTVTHEFKDTDHLMRMLLYRRADAAIDNDSVVKSWLKNNPIYSDKIKLTVQRDTPLGVYFSKIF